MTRDESALPAAIEEEADIVQHGAGPGTPRPPRDSDFVADGRSERLS